MPAFRARRRKPSAASIGAGLITTGGMGKKGEGVALTDAGRALVDPDGDLARSKSLITYCQL